MPPSYIIFGISKTLGVLEWSYLTGRVRPTLDQALTVLHTLKQGLLRVLPSDPIRIRIRDEVMERAKSGAILLGR